MRLSLGVLLICILSPIPVSAQTKVSGDDAETKAVLRAAEAFVEAFSNLDWEPFRAAFADDATMFFPFADGLLTRASGRAEIEARFKPAFGEDRKRGRVPPYLHIEPKDMKIQMAGDVAIMTFHLPGKGHMARRTLVWQKRGGRWLIVHLHASFIELPKAASGQQSLPAAVIRSGVTESEFVFETPFAIAHASTIVETKAGLIAAWFGGTREGADDAGIWVSRHTGGEWTRPAEVANGTEPGGTRYPCWNPVLFEMPDQTLMLFYKVGPNPQRWWGVVRTSGDSGLTWSNATRLPEGILGPIKNKPVRLADGSVLSPSSTESPDRPSTWRVHFERTVDAGRTWSAVRASVSTGDSQVDAIQPSILIHPAGRLQALGRTRSGRVFETWSNDSGRTWGRIQLTVLPNPNSGVDAVTLQDGRHLIVYNHATQGRSPLNVSLSRDGTTWEAALVLEREPGEYSYPAVIQTSDGLVHVTYTWKRQRIKHVVIDPKKLKSASMPDGRWPPEIE